MKQLFKKITNFKLSISVYLASLMGAIIIIVAFAFMLITLGNIKNMVGEYESDASKAKNYLAAILAHTIKQDVKSNHLKNTQSLLQFRSRFQIPQ